ncbi:putative ATP-dependent RNA helicase TDRD12 [Brevipalpus obovatus]|uniref:putative ATP-dependent RNA helicase TDRD12 n=1 Tax=Brevipalpus obovatus TaxID=246614 RepID=UPI003D9F5FD0
MNIQENEYIGASDNESCADDSESEIPRERTRRSTRSRESSNVGAGPSDLGDNQDGPSEWSHPRGINSFSNIHLLPKQAIVYGDRVPPATEKVSNIPGYSSKYLSKLVKKKYNLALPVQAYLWPAIFRGRSVKCISATKTGKTFSYLIPAMSGTQFSSPDNVLEYGDEGPRVVVICSSRKKANQVALIADEFQENRQPRVIVADYDTERKAKADLYNGSELLVATPGPLNRLIQDHAVNFEHCKLLVFDDADRSFAIHRENIQKIVVAYLRAYQKSLPKESQIGDALCAPILVLAETCTEEVRAFHFMEDPISIFGDFFEAALDQQMEIEAIYTDKRDEELFDLTERLIPKHEGKPLDRIAIVCNSNEDAEKISKNLEGFDVHPVRVDGTVPGFDIQSKVVQCKNDPKAITIIIDDLIKSTPQINFIEKLIHYTTPDLSEDQFRSRFMLMSSCIKNKLAISSYFLLDPNETKRAHQICKTLRRLEKPVPESVASLERQYSPPLCENFIQYAFCPYESSFCAYRHRFRKNDVPAPDLPTDGQLKFQVSKVISANHFYIIPLEYRGSGSADGSWKKFDRQLKEIKEALWRLKDSAKPVIQPKVNSIYGLAIRDEVHRVQVKCIEPLENGNQFVSIHFMDVGSTIKGPTFYFFELPENLRQYPALATPAYLMGIKPLDNETDWSRKATQHFEEKLDDSKNVVCLAWIKLQRKGIFWLDKMKVYQALDRKLHPIFSPWSDLIDHGLAENNLKTFPNSNTNIEMLQTRWSVARLSKKATYASIDRESMNFYFLSSFQSSDLFYLQPKKNMSLLSSLEKELKKDYSDGKLTPIRHFSDGLICAQYSEKSGTLNRISVLQASPSDADFEDHIFAFLLDYGETDWIKKTNCFVLNEQYVTRLPFQAIKCKLADYRVYIEPQDVYAYTRHIGSDGKMIYHDLVVKFVKKEEEMFHIQVFLKIDDSNMWHNMGEVLGRNGFTFDSIDISEFLPQQSPFEMISGEDEVGSPEGDLDDDDSDLEEWERAERRCAKNFQDIIWERILEANRDFLPHDTVQYDPGSRPQPTSRRARLREAVRRQPIYHDGSDSEDENFLPQDPPSQIDPSSILPYDPSDESNGESDIDGYDDADMLDDV